MFNCSTCSHAEPPPAAQSPFRKSSNCKEIFFARRTLGGSAGAAGISSHGDGLDVLLHILEELDGALKLPAVDGLGGLAGVLEGNSEVGAAGAGRLLGEDLLGSVSDLNGFRRRENVSRTRSFRREGIKVRFVEKYFAMHTKRENNESRLAQGRQQEQ